MSKERHNFTRREFLLGILRECLPPTPPPVPQVKPKEEGPFDDRRAESIIEQAYQQCFKEFEIEGKHVTLRAPFALFKERFAKQMPFLWGKGNVSQVWDLIQTELDSDYFLRYLEALRENKEKVIYFDLTTGRFALLSDKDLLKRMAALYSLWQDFVDTGNRNNIWRTTNLYPGNDSQVYIYKPDQKIKITDIYNYLYCVAQVGIDCARFTYHCQQALFGNELNNRLGKIFGVTPENAHYYVGSFFYGLSSGLVERTSDRIENLRPGDIIQFRGQTGSHNVIIQCVDIDRGFIRYLQCTDWALPGERGVHESFIFFNPNNPTLRLNDKSVVWQQRLCPTFPGEVKPLGWNTDGDRYRGTQSVVVRLIPKLTNGLT